MCLPLLIFPCTIKSRSSLLAPAHPGGPRKGPKMVVVALVVATYQAELAKGGTRETIYKAVILNHMLKMRMVSVR